MTLAIAAFLFGALVGALNGFLAGLAFGPSAEDEPPLEPDAIDEHEQMWSHQ